MLSRAGPSYGPIHSLVCERKKSWKFWAGHLILIALLKWENAINPGWRETWYVEEFLTRVGYFSLVSRPPDPNVPRPQLNSCRWGQMSKEDPHVKPCPSSNGELIRCSSKHKPRGWDQLFPLNLQFFEDTTPPPPNLPKPPAQPLVALPLCPALRISRIKG